MPQTTNSSGIRKRIQALRARWTESLIAKHGRSFAAFSWRVTRFNAATIVALSPLAFLISMERNAAIDLPQRIAWSAGVWLVVALPPFAMYLFASDTEDDI